MRRPIQARAAAHGVRWYHLVILLLLLLMPFVHGTALLTAPYGDSHDGRNGSIWAEGAQSLRADPLRSRLGAIRNGDRVYATHPPAILAALAAAESVAGDEPSTDRSVIYAGTAVALVLTFAVLIACGFAPIAGLVGVAAMAGSPMIRAYGTMVDTPMLAFPFACALVLLAVRLDSKEHLRWWDVAVIAVAPLVSWQLVLLEALLLVGLALDRQRRRHLRSVSAAFVAGSALTAAWLLWANGGAGPVIDQWLVRSSVDSEVGLRAAVDTQWQAGIQLLGPLLFLVPVAAVVGWTSMRRRWASGLSLAVVALYCLLLTDGAAHHDYWSYWVLLPVAIGAAGLVELLARLAVARAYPPALRIVLPAVAAAVLLVPATASRGLIEDVNRSSAQVAAVIAAAELAPGQRVLWALAEFRLGDTWMEDLGVPVRHLTEREYRQLVDRRQLDHVVVVSTSCTIDFIACDRIPLPVDPYRHRQFALVTIADLVDTRPRSG